jgi:hypothetical protein
VFIGTAVETRASGQNALFHVEEIWLGGPLPEWQVAIGTDNENTLWSGQPQFLPGARYLVVGYWHEGQLRPSGCDGTRPFSEAAAAVRPADATEPVPAPRPLIWDGSWSLSSALDTALTLVPVVALLALAALVWRRRGGSRNPTGTRIIGR